MGYSVSNDQSNNYSLTRRDYNVAYYVDPIIAVIIWSPVLIAMGYCFSANFFLYCGLGFIVFGIYQFIRLFLLLRLNDPDTVEVEISSDGIYINQPLEGPIMIAWDRVRSITICADESNPGYVYNGVVCYVYYNSAGKHKRERVAKISLSRYNFMFNPFRYERSLKYYAGDAIPVVVKRFPAYCLIGINPFRKDK